MSDQRVHCTKNMTKEEAIVYCVAHRDEFLSDAYECGEDGIRQYECLMDLLEDGSIQPADLPDYGMDYPNKED